MIKFLNDAINDWVFSQLRKEVKALIKPRVNYIERIAQDLVYNPHGTNSQINPKSWFLVFFKPPSNFFVGSSDKFPKRANLYKDIKLAYTAAAALYDNCDGHGYPGKLQDHVYIIEIVYPSDLLMFPEVNEVILINTKCK